MWKLEHISRRGYDFLPHLSNPWKSQYLHTSLLLVLGQDLALQGFRRNKKLKFLRIQPTRKVIPLNILYFFFDFWDWLMLVLLSAHIERLSGRPYAGCYETSSSSTSYRFPIIKVNLYLFQLLLILNQKSRIWETKNLSTDADSRTDTIWRG